MFGEEYYKSFKFYNLATKITSREILWSSILQNMSELLEDDVKVSEKDPNNYWDKSHTGTHSK